MAAVETKLEALRLPLEGTVPEEWAQTDLHGKEGEAAAANRE